MEPKLPIHSPGLERAPAGYGQNAEHAPSTSTPERAIERGTERLERGAETAPTAPMQPVLPAPISLPPVSVPTSVQVDDAADAGLADGAPLVANDDDLIEKEWVDKAKRIITKTKDDPYRREHEVSKLQADYLRKRYGRS